MPARFLSILFIFVLVGATGALDAAPEPATRTSDMLPLVDGSIRYFPPAGWKQVGKSDKLHASYATEDHRGIVSIAVTVEDREVPKDAAERMALIIGKAVRESAKKEGRQILYGPRVEKDPRFFLVIHDRITLSDPSKVSDRMQLYRVMGLNLVNVVVTAFVDRDAPPDQANSILSAGEAMLDGMRLTRGATPVVFGRTRVRLTTPIDWKLIKQDQPNGLTVTYVDPKNESRRIIVRSRVLPLAARTDSAKREVILNRMIEHGWTQPPLTHKPAGGGQPGTGKGNYLRQIRTTAGQGQTKLAVETRYMVVGDVILSIRTVSTEGDQAIGKVADDLAASAQAVGE